MVTLSQADLGVCDLQKPVKHAAHFHPLAWEVFVTYICFVESETSSVPHMHPLTAEDLETAQAEAQRLLNLHSSAVAAHIFFGEDRLMTIQAERQAA